MISKPVDPKRRHTRANPCLVCGGYGTMRKGKSERCYGFDSEDGMIHCTREEYGGMPWRDGTYLHITGKPCQCGQTHGTPQAYTPAPMGRKAHQRPATSGRVSPFPSPVMPAPDLAQKPSLIAAKNPSAIYDYRDAAGALVFQVLRYPLIDTDTGEITKGKTFKQRRPDASTRDGWRWTIAGIDRVLYRLPDLLAAPADRLVYIAEGEQCAAVLAALGLLGTSASGGAGNWRHTAEQARATLAGRHVVILPDNDPAQPGKPHESYKGQKHALDIAASLYGVAASVRVLLLPDLAPRGDVANWIAAGHTREELEALASVAPVYTPENIPALFPYLAPASAPDASPDLAQEEHQEHQGEQARQQARQQAQERPRRQERPPRTTLPVLAGTPEQHARMIWLEVNDYFTTDARDYLYTYVERGARVSDAQGIEEGEEESEERPGYYKPVNSWGMPRLVGMYRVDLGGDRLREEIFYQIEWSTHPEIGVKDVSGEKLSDGSCWAMWPDAPISSRRARDLYSDIVKAQAKACAIVLVQGYTTTGLHQDSITGAWRYLHLDGRCTSVSGEGSPIPLLAYTLPPRRAQAIANRMPSLDIPAPDLASVRALSAFYGRVSPHGHLAITVGAALRSLVSSIVPPATVLLAEGAAESGKTSSGTHARGVAAPSPYHTEADAHFNGTATSIEQALAPLQDIPAVVDNFRIKPGAAQSDIKKLAEELDRPIIAAESGNEMYGRGGRNGRVQKGNRLQTLALINGEQLPPSLVSTWRRVIYLPYTKGESLDVDMMEAQEASYQPVLLALGHSVIRSVLAALEQDADALRDTIERIETAYARRLLDVARSAGIAGTLYRSIPINWARILTGWRLAEMALGLQIIEADGGASIEADASAAIDGELVGAVYAHVVRWMRHHAQLAADGGTPIFTAEWVRNSTLAVFTRDAVIRDMRGGALLPDALPGLPSDWGYVPDRLTGNDAWKPRDGGEYLAGLSDDGETLYLRSSRWYTLLKKRADAERMEWTCTPQEFAGAIASLGISSPDKCKDGRNTLKMRFAGAPERCIPVPVAFLFGLDDDENTSDASRAPARVREDENSGYSGYAGTGTLPAQNTSALAPVPATTQPAGTAGTESITANGAQSQDTSGLASTPAAVPAAVAREEYAPDTREMIGASDVSDVATYPQQIGANGAPDLAQEGSEEYEEGEI